MTFVQGNAGHSETSLKAAPAMADADRVRDRIDKLSRLSETGPGISRLAYTPMERRAHDLFSEWMSAAGCSITTDNAGNTIALYRGADDCLGALGVGSHLDSVYNGGAFDGSAGVVAAAEIASMLYEQGIETRHPIRFVAFAGEEGARFGQACIGSKLAVGHTTRADLDHLVDRDGITLAEAMTHVNIDPDQAIANPWQRSEWVAFLELHIEQGDVLESENKQIGLVDLISGSTRLRLTLTGRSSHTGGTPMRGRSDALAAAAEAVLIAESLALDSAHRGTRATVGRLEVMPGSITTIPGKVTLALDIRDVDADRQREATSTIVQRILAACERRRVGLDVDLLADTSPVILPMLIRQQMSRAARDRGVTYRVLSSGASHDSLMINAIAPVGLLFTPSHEGLSHVPEELTEINDIVAGTNVLAATLLNLDESLDAPKP